MAACFVLKELAIAVPTLFHVNLNAFFLSIWTAIRDPRVDVREAATESLSACLQLIAMRQTRHRVQWYVHTLTSNSSIPAFVSQKIIMQVLQYI